MKASDAARRIKEKLGNLGQPPLPSEAGGALLLPEPARRGGRKRKAAKMAQLNLRVPEEIKDRVRVLAARDRIEMSEVVIEAIALYEAKYGIAPKLDPGRRE